MRCSKLHRSARRTPIGRAGFTGYSRSHRTSGNPPPASSWRRHQALAAQSQKGHTADERSAHAHGRAAGQVVLHVYVVCCTWPAGCCLPRTVTQADLGAVLCTGRRNLTCGPAVPSIAPSSTDGTKPELVARLMLRSNACAPHAAHGFTWAEWLVLGQGRPSRTYPPQGGRVARACRCPERQRAAIRAYPLCHLRQPR